METQLWSHQKKAIEFFKTHQNMGLLFEPGCGKTLTTIKIMEQIYTQSKRMLPTLVTCPVIVMENWKREILKYSSISKKSIVVLHGSEKERQRLVNAASYDSVFIVNFEGLRMKKLFAQLQAIDPDILILDESHRIKDPRTQTALALHKLSHPPKSQKRKFRFILSGTPIANNELDLWSQIYFLDQGKMLGQTYWDFRGRYFYDKNAGMPTQRHFPDWRPRPDTQNKLREMLNSICVFAKKSEVLDLPPLVRKTIMVPMSTEQNKAYQEMKKYLVTYLNDNEDTAAVAQTALTKSLRLQQIVSGFVKTETEAEITFDKNPRLSALKELLSDVAPDHKVIVWAVFKHNYAEIRKVCDELKLPYVELHGEVKNEDKFKNEQAFNNDPKIRVLIGHPGSGGVGVNLTASSYCIWFSRTFSNLEYEQATARNYRGGSEIHDSITSIDLVSPGTIDELVVEALAKKQSIAQTVVRELKEQAWKNK